MPRKPPYPRSVSGRRGWVFEQQGAYESQWAAITSIAQKFVMTAETLRSWVRQAETDTGKRPGVSSAEAERIKELERENRELCRANEILKAASAFPCAGARPATAQGMSVFIDEHRADFGVEPICHALELAPST
jgi:transposase-like protein